VRCPHCLVQFHGKSSYVHLQQDQDGDWGVVYQECPACHRVIVELVSDYLASSAGVKGTRRFVRPKAPNRAPAPPEVPERFAADYREACLVVADSPKASAALSRRCLQLILREKAGVKPSDLAKEIQEAISGGGLPSHLMESLDAIRNIGNFAAHPVKSRTTGEIVDVEPGEAEWNLDVLEALFDFYFVQPELDRKKRAALDRKLSDAGKPPMK